MSFVLDEAMNHLIAFFPRGKGGFEKQMACSLLEFVKILSLWLLYKNVSTTLNNDMKP